MKKITTHEFITRANMIHNLKFDYTKVMLVNTKTKVIITCPVHGDFKQTPNSHLRGDGCNKCGIIVTNQSNTQSKESFIEKAHKVHNNFYSYDKMTYTTVHHKLLITCPLHGDFLQQGNTHLAGSGCRICGKAKSGNSRSFFTGKRTILYVIKLNDDKYKVGVTSRTVQERYYSDTKDSYEILFQVSFFDGVDAFNIEQQIIKEFKLYTFVGEPVFARTKNHEVLTINPIKRITEIILNKVPS